MRKFKLSTFLFTKVVQSKLAGFLFLATVCSSSCSNKDDLNPFHSYYFYIAIQDVSGNDLIDGIGVDHDNELKDGEYSLEIVYPDLCMDVNYQRINYPSAYEYTSLRHQPAISVQKFGGRYFLGIFVVTNHRTMHIKNCPFANTLTFNLSCPYIFGDDAVREIVTYWSMDPSYHPEYQNNKKWFKNRPQSFCYRVVFDGKEITPITYGERNEKGGGWNNNSKVNVVLDAD